MTVSQIPSALNLTNKRAAKRGLTLVEIMIALTMTLIVLGAMMSAFRYASEKMQEGRGVMEMANRLRSAEELLRNDLANLTLDPRVYTEATSPNGFLEIIEGANNDSTINTVIGATASYLGDFDDTIGMTVRSAEGRRFRGVLTGTVIESTLAEVWYFTTLNDLETGGIEFTGDPAFDVDIEDSVRLHRRALLIRPDLNSATTGEITTVSTLAEAAVFVRDNDISVRVVEALPPSGTGVQYRIIANTLADLAIRKNRFAHTGDPLSTAIPPAHNFPNLFNTDVLVDSLLKFGGEDILLTDVAGFDVRVYSPNATVGYSANGILVQPGDLQYETVGFLPAVPAPPTPIPAAILENRAGAFVDLGYGFRADGTAIVGVDPTVEWFAGLGLGNIPGNPTLLPRVYDTWSPSYEQDGIDQDGVAGIDQGTNGLDDGGLVAPDDGGSAAPDDDLERETRPPYPDPIRGIQISTRLIEKTTQQVFQSSVIQSYVPE